MKGHCGDVWLVWNQGQSVLTLYWEFWPGWRMHVIHWGQGQGVIVFDGLFD